ncbi:hypothetical protein [Sinosporangium siamense]|uniref:Uncharacterized protein n=1 Tax=Sinosporangium siamense TaxID=1367973 RepID=A0A919RF00_9ACTN|nr:hypothetical protein [Sinosporangium siamense]GII90656.1 hypothetical protein Ssi02_08870 [Sinosporangium siamense]
MNDPFADLLRVPGSELARRLRAGLELIDAALRDGSTAAGDPGAAHYPEVREHLLRLLAPHSAAPAPAQPPAPVPSPAVSRQILLLEEFAGSTAARALGPRPVPHDPAQAWERFHLDLLRLPEPEARPWSRRAEQLKVSRTAQWIDLPAWGDPEVLVYPWPKAGVAGLRTARGAAPYPEVVAALGNAPGAARLAVLCTHLLAVAERDRELYDWASGVHDRMPLLSDPQVRDLLRGRLLKRLEAYGRAGDAETALTRFVEVDEYLCSVVHLPLPAGESWWSRLWQASRAELLPLRGRVPGAVVRRFDAPGTRMDEIAKWTSGDVRVEGQDGRVLHCLRVYAEVGGRQRPGRVIFGARS